MENSKANIGSIEDKRSLIKIEVKENIIYLDHCLLKVMQFKFNEALKDIQIMHVY